MIRNSALNDALKGLTVVDFSTLLPGPYASHLLAEMGARVIRIESPTRPDMLQFLPPIIDGLSAAHRTIHRDKESLAVDLKTDHGIAIAKQWIARSDVVIEGFRPGVMARLGLGYDDVKELNAGLIYCSITGYGQQGELAGRAGHDINYIALSGLASYSGLANTGPVLSGFQIADIAGGSHSAVMSIQAALIKRSVSGLGQYIDISMLDAAVSFNAINGANVLAGAPSPQLGKDILAGGSIYGYYRCADDRYLSVGALEPQFLSGLIEALDLEQQFDKTDVTLLMSREFKKALTQVFESRTLNDWITHFSSLDCCVEPVLSVEEALNSAWCDERGMIKTTESLRQLNSSLTSNSNKQGEAPKTGEHSRALLRELGITEEKIDQYIESGVVV